jgi:pyruvate carboxylase subunit B
MRYHVTLGDRPFIVDVEADGVRLDGEPLVAELRSLGRSGVHGLVMGGAVHRVVARDEGEGRWALVIDGASLGADVLDQRTHAIRALAASASAAAGPRALRAPMPGLVVKVEVAEGDAVAEGQGLVIVEAMKMENELRAEAAAVVHRVLVTVGQAVEKNQVLIELSLAGAAEGDEA